MRSGIVGKDKPIFEEDKNGNIVSCTVTVKRKLPGRQTIGDFAETVYFAEYSTQRNLWVSKPRTMLAKVAEMHALRPGLSPRDSPKATSRKSWKRRMPRQFVRPST